MDEPKPLESLFKEKIFRIPDYQRGYAWQQPQWKDFWEDLINLADNRSHYTGVLTLRQIQKVEIKEVDNEYWLVEDHSYGMYHIVDGQQRLTTFIIFIQSFIDFFMSLPENKEKPLDKIYVTDSLDLQSIIKKFLFEEYPSGNHFRTYKFGYTVDNPSYQFLRYRIFNEEGAGTIEETFYTLNLKNAKIYFKEQLDYLYNDEGIEGIKKVYKKLTKNLLFNEYVIKDEFDVFVAFETMNNRGKKLSDLELLKNRLIYLTTLYPENELKKASRSDLRKNINLAWKEVYHQLGRNEKRPLNDDDFLKAHWIMYFKYSRERGNDYINYLLNEQFTPKNIHKKIEKEVKIEAPVEQRTDLEMEDSDSENGTEEIKIIRTSTLEPKEIEDYVKSLKSCAVHWFNSHYPELASGMSDNEKKSIDRLNRVGMGYFRPLVMAILKNEKEETERIKIFDRIERFIFVVFRLSQARRNYGDSVFYNAAREYDKKEITIANIEDKLSWKEEYTFNADETFKSKYFKDYMYSKFNSGERQGFYYWHGLKYFLFEYEQELMNQGRHNKTLSWADLMKFENDKISIEHIYPQTATDYWNQQFIAIPDDQKHLYKGSLGNLLLLSGSINSSLQNDSYEEKKQPKYDENSNKIRNGYLDGSHSEIELSQKFPEWNPDAVLKRGLDLLNFMEKRWDIEFEDEKDKLEILHLYFNNNPEQPIENGDSSNSSESNNL